MTNQTLATIVLFVVYIPVLTLIYFVAIRIREINIRLNILEEDFEDNFFCDECDRPKKECLCDLNGGIKVVYEH